MEGQLPLDRGRNILIKKLMCTAVLLLGATALRADVFSFSYSGTTGTLTATGLGGLYTITGLSGLRNNVAISAPSRGMGTFIYSGSSGVGTFDFLLASGGSDLVTFIGGGYTEIGTTGIRAGSGLTMSRVPEAATLSLLFTMGLGVWVLARKLPSKSLPLS